MSQQQQNCTVTPTEWNHSFFCALFILNDSKRVFGWKDNLRNCVYKISCGVYPYLHPRCIFTVQTRLSWTFATSSAGLTLDDRQPDFTIWSTLGWTVEQHCRNVKMNIATKCQEKKQKTGPLLQGIVGADLALSCQVKCFRWKVQKQYSTTHNNTDTIKTQCHSPSFSLLHNINMIISAVGAVQTTDWPRELGVILSEIYWKIVFGLARLSLKTLEKLFQSPTVWQALENTLLCLSISCVWGGEMITL